MNNNNPNLSKQRLGEHYERYIKTNYNAFDSYNNENDLQQVFNNTKSLSIRQEPNVIYEQKVEYICINSNERDISAYPNSNNFSVKLNETFKNIYSIELIDATVPDKNNIEQQPYLLLQVDQIQDTINSTNSALASSFAILKLLPAITPGFFISMDRSSWEKTPKIYKDSKASLSRMTISIKKPDGTLFDFVQDTPVNPLYQCLFTFKITMREPIRETNRNV